MVLLLTSFENDQKQKRKHEKYAFILKIYKRIQIFNNSVNWIQKKEKIPANYELKKIKKACKGYFN